MLGTAQAAWTEAETQTLRRLWSEGYSASQIAKALGTGRSRNSCIGKINRLGLSGTPRAPRNRAPVKSHIKNARIRHGATARRAAKASRAPQADAPSLREALILSLPPLEPARRIASIQDRECRFICGDPLTDAHAFCARPAVSGGSWCKHHLWLVTAPTLRPKLKQEQQHEQGAGA